ncbi:uncharacterized protein B0P05DRAFT_542268 [Gilbertella persicaria]|uniref:uncharacterized protein n=1 Tax=Gilbertella persicaria TaxID=101096 RepID=UPI0022203A25|nr:uncharacterized protein B0P05DRAFT_542268 [Gilbertella persicaria]KAI8079086.1 hypothetical protein B0P05DRAFT_542268 [Gilbertella persicaria]
MYFITCIRTSIYSALRLYIDANILASSYSIAQTAWTAKKVVYTLYVSQNANDERLVPILITLYEEVDQVIMLDNIVHSIMVAEEFGILPAVLIISIKGSSNLMMLYYF